MEDGLTGSVCSAWSLSSTLTSCRHRRRHRCCCADLFADRPLGGGAVRPPPLPPPRRCAHSFLVGPHLFVDASVVAVSRNRCRRPRHDAITGVRALQIGCPSFDWNWRPYNPIRSSVVDSEVVRRNSRASGLRQFAHSGLVLSAKARITALTSCFARSNLPAQR